VFALIYIPMCSVQGLLFLHTPPQHLLFVFFVIATLGE
jgi:hypothetical protein